MISTVWEHRRPLGSGAAPPGTRWPEKWVFGGVNGRPLVLCFQGELNGQKGLVPSNFLEEVPDDVEVYLSDAPSHCAQDTPARSKAKRVSRRGQRPQLPSPTTDGLAVCALFLCLGPKSKHPERSLCPLTGVVTKIS